MGLIHEVAKRHSDETCPEGDYFKPDPEKEKFMEDLFQRCSGLMDSIPCDSYSSDFYMGRVLRDLEEADAYVQTLGDAGKEYYNEMFTPLLERIKKMNYQLTLSQIRP